MSEETTPNPAPEPAPETPEPDTTGIAGTDIHMDPPKQSSAPSTAPSTSAASGPSAPSPKNDNQFVFICMGVTFFVVLIGISLGGVGHFFPGLFANRTDAEIAADVEAQRAAERGEQPATSSPAPRYVPKTTVTASPPAQAPPARPLPPTADVEQAMALLDSEDAADRAAGLKALQQAGAAGVTALLSRLRSEQAATAEAKARAKELERALQSALAQTTLERERREEAESRSDDKRAVDLYQQATDAAAAKNFDKARVLAEAVIRLSPDHVGARALRARAALTLGDPRAAFQDYLVAIRLDPRFSAHHRGMGQALLDMNRPKEAEAAFERALSIDPGDLEAIKLRNLAASKSDPKGPEGK